MQSSADPLVGRPLAHYEVVAHLGGGGMGLDGRSALFRDGGRHGAVATASIMTGCSELRALYRLQPLSQDSAPTR